ncbi:MAG TPA: imidazolonepropionase [candidate division Zixibacteria bacterium]|nr:imidazolonepropionase [candidate division Zixibacteria bacterium]
MAEGVLLIENIGQLATCAGGKAGPVVDTFEKALGLKGAVSIAIENGKILVIGKKEELSAQFNRDRFDRLDAGGGLVTPGLVDCHTHPVFAGDRKEEFELRNRGVSYETIARKGGGIFSTVRATRKASSEELERLFLQRLKCFLAAGATTLEAKSGYGLSLEDEMKQLEVIRRAQSKQPVELIPTFLGAHTVPPEFKGKRREYVRLLMERLLPEVAEKKLAVFCDVFAEKIAFSYSEAKEILLAGKKLGFLPKLHADQLSNGNGAKLAAEVGAVSADHLEHISDGGIKVLKKAGTVAVLLPSASFYLRSKKTPPVKKLLAAGVPLALATDFNPGTSPNYSMTFTMMLACVEWGFSAAQALLAATRNAAYALGKGGEVGFLAAGKQADLVVWEAKDYRELSYYAGVYLAKLVVKKGKVVWQK